MEGNYGRRFVAPVKIGDEVDVHIDAIGEKGDGIAKYEGFVIFVPGAKEGQDVKVRIEKVFKKFAFGAIIGEGAPQEADSGDVEEFGDEEEEPIEEAEEETPAEEPAEEEPAEEPAEEEPAEEEPAEEEPEEEKEE